MLNGVFHKVINYVLFCLQLLSNINGLISKSLLDKYIALDNDLIRGIAHITGGGIALNLERIIPKDFTAVVNLKDYQVPVLYEVIMNKGDLSFQEMFKIFNMGIGMVVISSEDLSNETSLIKLGHISKK